MGFRLLHPDDIEASMVNDSDTKYTLCLIGDGALVFLEELEMLFFPPGTPQSAELELGLHWGDGVWQHWLILPRTKQNLRRISYVTKKFKFEASVGRLVADLYPELKKEIDRDEIKTHLEDMTTSERKRRKLPAQVQQAVWERDDGRCVACGTSENLHFDHIIPFSKGGSDTVENIQILCRDCNLKKGAKIGGEE